MVKHIRQKDSEESGIRIENFGIDKIEVELTKWY